MISFEGKLTNSGLLISTRLANIVEKSLFTFSQAELDGTMKVNFLLGWSCSRRTLSLVATDRLQE